MECGIIEPQSQYISPRLICIDTGKDQKMQRKRFRLKFLIFFKKIYRIWPKTGFDTHLGIMCQINNVTTSGKNTTCTLIIHLQF